MPWVADFRLYRAAQDIVTFGFSTFIAPPLCHVYLLYARCQAHCSSVLGHVSRKFLHHIRTTREVVAQDLLTLLSCDAVEVGCCPLYCKIHDTCWDAVRIVVTEQQSTKAETLDSVVAHDQVADSILSQ